MQDQVTQRPRQRRSRAILRAVVFFMSLSIMMIGAGAVGAYLMSLTSRSTQPPLLTPATDGNKLITSEEQAIDNVVHSVSKSVVSIITTGGGQQGAGTGIIISQDGYILTNKHVVSGARAIEVIASDGTRYDDVVPVGEDPLNDIAFVKIRKARDLPAATLGDSGTTRVGQRVIAIGNSLGQYQNTVTSGIISGKGRPIQAALDEDGSAVENLSDLIQTDAAINHGNSGGPLINMSGQVIGINTAIVSGAQSIGFAIPINAAKGLVRGVLASGEIKKSYIGVSYLAITPDVKSEYNLKVNSGAYIGGAGSRPVVARGGPAEKAGIVKGDIITKVNDKTVGDHGGLGSLLAEFLPGETVKLTLLRDGREMVVELTLGRYQS